MTPLAELPESTRVWVYQANKPFTSGDVPQIEDELSAFAERWISHNQALRASAAVLFDRFVILAVDESMAGASGCSIDSSVHFMQELGTSYQRDLFNRMRFSFEKEGTVHTVSREEFEQLYSDGKITDDTPVFDPLVKNLSELKATFKKRLADSWHVRFV